MVKHKRQKSPENETPSHTTRDAFINKLIVGFFSRHEFGPPVLAQDKHNINTLI